MTSDSASAGSELRQKIVRAIALLLAVALIAFLSICEPLWVNAALSTVLIVVAANPSTGGLAAGQTRLAAVFTAAMLVALGGLSRSGSAVGIRDGSTPSTGRLRHRWRTTTSTRPRSRACGPGPEGLSGPLGCRPGSAAVIADCVDRLPR